MQIRKPKGKIERQQKPRSHSSFPITRLPVHISSPRAPSPPFHRVQAQSHHTLLTLPFPLRIPNTSSLPVLTPYILSTTLKMSIQHTPFTSCKSSTTLTSHGLVIVDVGSWKANGEMGPVSEGSGVGRQMVGGERRGRFAGEWDERGERGRGGCELSASEGRGAEACSKRPRRLPSGRSMSRSMVFSPASSGVSCRFRSCSDLVGELAVETDIALEESESDSSLILVLSGSKIWC